MWVENRSDELWIGVKGQSNWEIAGSLRNIFRYGLRWSLWEVEHCMGEGVSQPTDPKQTPNAREREPGRQEPCDNVRLREGKNPDRRLSVPKYGLSGEEKDVNSLRQLGGWLRSSHSFKECVIAHQSSGFAPKMVGTKSVTEATGRIQGFVPGAAVGERRQCSEG